METRLAVKTILRNVESTIQLDHPELLDYFKYQHHTRYYDYAKSAYMAKVGATPSTRTPLASASPDLIYSITPEHIYGRVTPQLEAIHKAFRKDIRFTAGDLSRREGNLTTKGFLKQEGNRIEFVSDGYSLCSIDSAEFLIHNTPLNRERKSPKPRPWVNQTDPVDLAKILDFKKLRPVGIVGSADTSPPAVVSCLVFRPGNIHVNASLFVPVIAATLAQGKSVRFESNGKPLDPVYLFTDEKESKFLGAVMPRRI